MLDQLSSLIANKIADNTDATQDGREVIEYGVMAILHITFFLLLISSLGLIFGVYMPIMTICLSAAFFRQHSGGSHALNSLFCTSIGCVVCLVLSLLCKVASTYSIPLYFYIILSIVSIIAALAATIILVPVDTPNKPIKSEIKKKRMKRNSFIILTIYSVLLAVSIIIGQSYTNWLLFNLCMSLGILWQTFMLTKAGEVFLQGVQIPLKKIIATFSRH